MLRINIPIATNLGAKSAPILDTVNFLILFEAIYITIETVIKKALAYISLLSLNIVSPLRYKSSLQTLLMQLAMP